MGSLGGHAKSDENGIHFRQVGRRPYRLLALFTQYVSPRPVSDPTCKQARRRRRERWTHCQTA